MPIHLGKPRNVWADTTADFAEHRAVYSNFISVLLAENYEFSIYEQRPGIEEFYQASMVEGITYSYHAESPGLRSFCFKRGPLPFLWHMNEGGYSGWCSLANDIALQTASNDFAPDRARAIIASYRDKLATQMYTLIPQPGAVLEPEIAALETYLFFPLQVNTDEVMKLSRFAQFELIRTTGEIAEKLQRHVVFKRHPLCASMAVEGALAHFLGSTYVHQSTAPTVDLITHANAVALINSSVGVQALILNKPVYTFGRSEYAHMTIRLSAPQEIVQALTKPGEPPQNTHLNALAYLLDHYLVDMNNPAKIAARLKTHVNESSDRTGVSISTQPRLNPDQRRTLSLGRALEKDSRELLDLQLEMYGNLTNEAKTKAARLLARLARSGHFVERIIQYTDADVAHQCLRYLEAKGDQSGFSRIAQLVVAREPENIALLYKLSKALYDLKRDKEGLAYAKQAADLENASAPIIVFYARKVRKSISDLDPVMRILIDRALTLEPQNARGLWLLAIILSKEGNFTQAADTIGQALTCDPSNQDYLNLQRVITESG